MHYSELDWEVLGKAINRKNENINGYREEYILCGDCSWVGSILNIIKNTNSPYICPECKSECIYPIDW